MTIQIMTASEKCTYNLIMMVASPWSYDCILGAQPTFLRCPAVTCSQFATFPPKPNWYLAKMPPNEQ